MVLQIITCQPVIDKLLDVCSKCERFFFAKLKTQSEIDAENEPEKEVPAGESTFDDEDNASENNSYGEVNELSKSLQRISTSEHRERAATSTRKRTW